MILSTDLVIFYHTGHFFAILYTFGKALHFFGDSVFFERLFRRVDIVTYLKCKTLGTIEFSIIPSVVTKYKVYSMGITLNICRVIRIYLVRPVSKHYITITECAE